MSRCSAWPATSLQLPSRHLLSRPHEHRARAESKEQRESKAQRREHHSAESIAAQRADSNETCFMYVAARAESNESIAAQRAAQALRASESSSLGCGNPPREDAEFVCVCVCVCVLEVKPLEGHPADVVMVHVAPVEMRPVVPRPSFETHRPTRLFLAPSLMVAQTEVYPPSSLLRR